MKKKTKSHQQVRSKFTSEMDWLVEEHDRAIRMLNDRLYRIESAEQLLKEIKLTGSHYQIKEKIDRYFKEFNSVP